MNKLLPIIIAAIASGCAVGPDYQAPQSPHSETFYTASAKQQAQAATHSARQTFWRGFQDPVLEELIKETLAENYDLQAMLARYRGAEALLRHARREQWPSVTASAGASHQQLAEVERARPEADELDLYEAGAALRWEIDLFGRLARATQAQQALFEAAGADVQALQVALAGQLANSYFELRGLQEQLEVTQHNVALQQSSLEIVSARLKAGRGSQFDLFRARAQLNTTRAAMPELQAGIRASMHRIAVLTGKPPGTLIDKLSVGTGLPEIVPFIPVGTPGQVLRRRPDIRAAERRVAAASARIGVATADLFPRFTLQGLAGSLATSGGDLFTSGAESHRVVLGIDWSFLNRALVTARIDAADADAEAALAEYRQTVLLALEETETWLVRYQQAQARVDFLSDAAQAADQAVAQARERYEQGYIGYFELLTAELEFSRARDSLVQGKTSHALAMISVYRSLAGAPASSEQEVFESVALSGFSGS
jgi:multidrug efflux system outer membrane protein